MTFLEFYRDVGPGRVVEVLFSSDVDAHTIHPPALTEVLSVVLRLSVVEGQAADLFAPVAEPPRPSIASIASDEWTVRSRLAAGPKQADRRVYSSIVGQVTRSGPHRRTSPCDAHASARFSREASS